MPPVRLGCRGQRLLIGQRDDRLKVIVMTMNLGQVRLHYLHRGRLLLPNQRRELTGRTKDKGINAHAAVYRGPRSGMRQICPSLLARRADLHVHKVGAVRDVHGLHQLGVANTVDRAQGQVMLPRELTAQRQQSLAQPLRIELSAQAG